VLSGFHVGKFGVPPLELLSNGISKDFGASQKGYIKKLWGVD
jgi:hypothetical protein